MLHSGCLSVLNLDLNMHKCYNRCYVFVLPTYLLIGMVRRLSLSKQEKRDFWLSNTTPIDVVRYQVIRGPGRKKIARGLIGTAAVRFSDNVAFKSAGFEYRGLTPAVLKIAPKFHLYVVLERRLRRRIVALIDSEHAWIMFRRHYSVTERSNIRYRILDADDSRETIRNAHLNAGLRRQPLSGWT